LFFRIFPVLVEEPSNKAGGTGITIYLQSSVENIKLMGPYNIHLCQDITTSTHRLAGDLDGGA
jgi:hypothetical protein